MLVQDSFIEKKIEEFERRINEDNYETRDEFSSLKKGSDTLLDETFYPESAYELDSDKVNDFIRQALQEQQERFKKLIVDEISQAHIDGEKTSRLTSLYNKIK